MQPTNLSRFGKVNPVLVAVIVLVIAGAAAAWYFTREEDVPQDLKVIVDGKEVDPKQFMKDGKIQLQGGGEWNMKDAKINPQMPMQSLVTDYFALPAGPQRQKYLDEMIDQQEKTRKALNLETGADGMPKIKMDGAAAAPGGTTQPSKIMIRAGGPGMMDSMPPELRAQLAEFKAAIDKRRAERGLPPQQGMMFIRQKQGS